MKRAPFQLVLGFFYLLAITASSCSKSEDDPGGPSGVMFINGLTDGKVSTVLVTDSVYTSLTAGFGNFTQYQDVSSGDHTFKLRDNTNNTVILTGSFKIGGDTHYSLMAVNSSLNPEWVLVEDDLSVADTSKAYIRLINLCPNSGSMQLKITSGADVVNSLNYKAASAFQAMAPGKTNFTIISGSTMVSSISNFNLLAGKKYSVLMTGLVNQTPKASHNIVVNK